MLTPLSARVLFLDHATHTFSPHTSEALELNFAFKVLRLLKQKKAAGYKTQELMRRRKGGCLRRRRGAAHPKGAFLNVCVTKSKMETIRAEFLFASKSKPPLSCSAALIRGNLSLSLSLFSARHSPNHRARHRQTHT